MKDIPMFVTDYGVASIILKEVPYKALAYIRVQDVQPGGLEALIEDCASFCRAAGADHILATGHEELERYPFHCEIHIMTGPTDFPPEGKLWPVLEENVKQWREICNEKMKIVDNSATLTAFDEKMLVSSAGTYFVHDGQKLLGIGWVEEGELRCLASVVPGQGRGVLATLLSTLDCDRVRLDVASTNLRAIRLYESMGFVKTGVRSRWYKIK